MRPLEARLGLFFIAMIPARRWMAQQHLRPRLWHLCAFGAGIGFLTGIVATTGPINAPFFLADGLVKGAYLGSEAMGSLAVYVAKAIIFRSLGALPLATLAKSVVVGTSLVAGAFIGRHFVRQLDPQSFRLMVDGLLLLEGVARMWAAALP